MIYIDTHAHLLLEDYPDRDEVVERCNKADVKEIMIITLHTEETLQAIEYVKEKNLPYTIASGIFPDDVNDVTEESWKEFVEVASREEVTCIGEIGLDYHFDKDPEVHRKQRELFIKQIELAKKLRKPIIVHSRDAMQDTYDILKKYQCPGLLHCFSGTKEMAKEFTKLGYYIALGGALTFKNARHSVEVAQTIDEKYLLTETDCPYMAPVPLRGTRNEPTYIPYILKKMAEVRNVSEEHMADVVYQNWHRYLESYHEKN